MARAVRNPKIDTRSARARLVQRREPYWTVISEVAPSAIAAARTAAPGSPSSVTENGKRHLEALGPADDARDADGLTVFSFGKRKSGTRMVPASGSGGCRRSRSARSALHRRRCARRLSCRLSAPRRQGGRSARLVCGRLDQAGTGRYRLGEADQDADRRLASQGRRDAAAAACKGRAEPEAPGSRYEPRSGAPPPLDGEPRADDPEGRAQSRAPGRTSARAMMRGARCAPSARPMPPGSATCPTMKPAG